MGLLTKWLMILSTCAVSTTAIAGPSCSFWSEGINPKTGRYIPTTPMEMIGSDEWISKVGDDVLLRAQFNEQYGNMSHDAYTIQVFLLDDKPENMHMGLTYGGKHYIVIGGGGGRFSSFVQVFANTSDGFITIGCLQKE